VDLKMHSQTKIPFGDTQATTPTLGITIFWFFTFRRVFVAFAAQSCHVTPKLGFPKAAKQVKVCW